MQKQNALKESISITSIASLSALGNNSAEIWKNYLNENHFLTQKKFGETSSFVATLNKQTKELISELKNSDSKYNRLDDTVLFAMLAARNAVKNAGWKKEDNFGINIGSSRGATQLFEQYHSDFLAKGKTSTLASPTTTLGNISSWVAHDLQSNGPEISHSITCSTALHSLLNAVAWITSGLTDKFLVGGSEAALTDFTIAQMKALKIYSNKNDEYPCKAFDLKKKSNTMVLGEGASVVCLEKGEQENSLAKIIGVGYATEILEHNISISTEANCFQKSMKMALGNYSPEEVDIVVMHAPGTIKGDLSESKAIEKVFGKKQPFLTTNKWKIGHTFGASGSLSLELAVLMLQHQQAIPTPFNKEEQRPKKINKIMINAVGFGGNAVSVLLSN